jgi:hypothetical protein
MTRTLKVGLVVLGLGLLGFLCVFTVLGPLGPCASDSQAAALFLGLAGSGIGGLICLVALPGVLLAKYKARAADTSSPPRGE